MRMRTALLAISLGLACGALAAEPAPKPEPRAQPSKEPQPAATWGHLEGRIEESVFQDGNMKSADGEKAGSENQIVFATLGEPSRSMDEMRARLADPEQRKAMRTQNRASLEQIYPDVEEVLNLDATTHATLMDLLTDQYMDSLDAMFGEHRREASFATQGLAAAENRKLDQLRVVLGDDGLARYQEYTATVHERRQVREVDAALGATDKLSPEQKVRLVRLFQETNRMSLPPPGPSRMSALLRSRDPRSPGFKEDLQRQSQLSTIEGNQEVLRLREASNRRMAEQASGFLSPVQNAALTKANEANEARLRQWIVQARATAGLDPAIPERGSDENPPRRKPVSGEVTLDITVRIDGGEPVHVTHTGPNGEPLKFKASEDLFAEAEWTLFDDNWVDVRLAFFEDGPNGLRRLQGGAGLAAMGRVIDDSAPGRNTIGHRGTSSTIVTGRRAYSVELSASAAAR